MLCSCGKDAYPQYDNLCEDCWLDNHLGYSLPRFSFSKFLQTNPTKPDKTIPQDKFWWRLKGFHTNKG